MDIEVRNNRKINVSSFSKIIAEHLNIDSNIIRNYIFANISISLTRSKEMKKDIDKIYYEDRLKYYNAAINDTCINYTTIKQANIEQEIYSRRIVGVLIEGETDSMLRSKIIKVLRKYYPIIYNAVKKHDKKILKNRYMKMDLITRNIEAKFDAAVYLYFAIYISPEIVDQGFVISILNDIEEFESKNFINQNIDMEFDNYKNRIKEVRLLIKRKFGKIYNFKDILRNNNEDVRKLGEILEDLFIMNGINIESMFEDSQFICIEKIILPYVRIVKNEDSDIILFSIISGIFMQSLINEYKKARNLYFNNMEESSSYKLSILEEQMIEVKKENISLKNKLDYFNKEKLMYEKRLKSELSKLDSIYKLEIKKKEDQIRILENKLNEEKILKLDLEYLKEYEFNSDTNHRISDSNKRLEKYTIIKKIIIIGGDKEWRRRFRIKYPEIRMLNGFNENFDIRILNTADYIFFYTQYMNHSTFHRAMDFIKLNKCKFGYIGKTNIDLVEGEIIEKIVTCEGNNEEYIY
ncbi:hypothetical protein [Clostridium beijerinckii]|uniref:DUF2325 domain-containing protein n=3 Tax=Clostridium beijerinckii TaxID=1520 RepID=A0A1S8R9U5_CLOBE|nr:hypothetical protein [Clostridium beijerinckii]ABR34120.1 hypothetical protein Cbei_1950 [Clostridium beijerinckii NCIMB 8052]AIU01304.1 hypothetical protein Cbs_1950 [Clostridium beijerinckii ATCC 35702]MBE6088465.1 hypothetical protein [Clostridium beijerinckii]MBF7811276.1 hypothetical protein [Clostridium beijerinckii]NOW92021.1 hypothetical protein [Clostridium beijerinckii]